MIVRDEFYLRSAVPQRQVRGFGFFLTDIIGGIASIFAPKTAPAPPPQTVTVNVPPPPPESPWETSGGVLAIVGATAVASLLIYTLGKD